MERGDAQRAHQRQESRVRMMIAEEVSINTPAIRMMSEIRNRMTYLLVETLSTAVEWLPESSSWPAPAERAAAR